MSDAASAHPPLKPCGRSRGKQDDLILDDPIQGITVRAEVNARPITSVCFNVPMVIAFHLAAQLV